MAILNTANATALKGIIQGSRDTQQTGFHELVFNICDDLKGIRKDLEDVIDTLGYIGIVREYEGIIIDYKGKAIHNVSNNIIYDTKYGNLVCYGVHNLNKSNDAYLVELMTSRNKESIKELKQFVNDCKVFVQEEKEYLMNLNL